MLGIFRLVVFQFDRAKGKKLERNKKDLAGNHCDIRRASMTEMKTKKIVLDANENEFVRALEVC